MHTNTYTISLYITREPETRTCVSLLYNRARTRNEDYHRITETRDTSGGKPLLNYRRIIVKQRLPRRSARSSFRFVPISRQVEEEGFRSTGPCVFVQALVTRASREVGRPSWLSSSVANYFRDLCDVTTLLSSTSLA